MTLPRVYTDSFPFLQGGGEMGQLTRQFDWSKTSLGTPDTWPASLCISLGILLNSKFPMFLYWGPDYICFYNDAYRPSLGITGKHPAVLGSRGEDIWPEVWAFNRPRLNAIMAGGEATWEEDQLLPIYRNGKMEPVYWTYSYSPVKDEKGFIRGVFVACTETTQKVLTVQQLAVSEQRFQNLIRQATAGIIVLIGESLQVAIVNEAYARLVNRTVEELLHHPLFEIIPEAADPFQTIIQGVMQSGDPLYLYEQPYQIQVESGSMQGFLNLIYQPYREQDGTITGVIVFCQDVTSQVQAQQELLNKSRDLELALTIGNLGSFKVDLVSRLSIHSQPIVDWFELPSQTYLLDEVFQLIHEQDRARTIQAIEDSIAGKQGGYHDVTYRVISRQNGHLRYLHSMGQVLTEKGKPISISGIIQDVTPTVVSRQALEESEAALRDAIELAELTTWTIDLTNGQMYTSEKYARKFGLSHTEISLEEAWSMVHPDDRGHLTRLWEQSLSPESNGRFEAEYRILNAETSQPLAIQVIGQHYRNAKGEAHLFLGTARDITLERELQTTLENEVQKRTEELAAMNEELQASSEEVVKSNEILSTHLEEMTQLNRLLHLSNDRLKQFAYVASHDLQEPLRKIQAFSTLIEKKYADRLDEQGLTILSKITKSGEQMSTLIQDLLAFSRLAVDQDEKMIVSLQRVLARVLESLEIRLQETKADLQIDPLPALLGDESQLRQLFQNLLSNALKFVKAGEMPRIHVYSQLITSADLPPELQTVLKAPRYYRISVADQGIGFEPQYAERLFEVFQRLHTRQQYKGTGIGLAICQRVMENHQGAITAESEPGQGATFHVFFPT
ncbi:PAS domain-containing sensor histidine kinase [Siphonobacter curvatus]|uniref:histidine kinase n=1 Tax=Siphonobacter curvatus TaxID=2094562 RepID=A0A2S7IK10_9BACT|nr:PAS domain-containing sensor histidine kinase [Siphonobacter curvatus]PQA56983.1 hypothetical protein C5O19_16775 [Siphonobacter curvatus]